MTDLVSVRQVMAALQSIINDIETKSSARVIVKVVDEARVVSELEKGGDVIIVIYGYHHQLHQLFRHSASMLQATTTCYNYSLA